jgi:hypothetical protein
MSRNKRVDANHAHLVDLARRCGAHVISMTPNPAAGFDLLIVRGDTFIVEVKDPAQSDSHRQLTEGEQKRKQLVEEAGGHYHVIQTDDDLLILFGLKSPEERAKP